MNSVVLLFGGNLGDEIKLFVEAENILMQNFDRCICKSAIYTSPPWGFKHTNFFYNQVFVFQTELSALQILDICLQTEKELGRIRGNSQGYQARKIDIDILYFNSEIIQEKTLIIPHPHIQNRQFTLVPLTEILPDFIHPVFAKTNTELLLECKDSDYNVEKVIS